MSSYFIVDHKTNRICILFPRVLGSQGGWFSSTCIAGRGRRGRRCSRQAPHLHLRGAPATLAAAEGVGGGGVRVLAALGVGLPNRTFVVAEAQVVIAPHRPHVGAAEGVTFFVTPGTAVEQPVLSRRARAEPEEEARTRRR